MYEEGYAGSGKGAHEGEVSFTQTLGFPDAETRFLDQLRHFRNRILYYGKQFDTEYAIKVLEFTETVYERLK